MPLLCYAGLRKPNSSTGSIISTVSHTVLGKPAVMRAI